jgi:predicted PurR-regulated permease PerM
MNRQLKSFAQFFRELGHFLRLCAFLPAHPQRVAQHDFLHLILADNLLQTAKVRAVVLALKRLQPLGRDAQWIGHRQPYAAAAVIDGQDASGGSHSANYTSFCISPTCMASNRVIPPAPEQLRPEEAPDSQLAEKELEQRNERKLYTALHAGAVAQIIVGGAVILAICYVAKLVLVTLLVSLLLAFMLEPLVNLLERIRVPRAAGAFLSVLLMLAAMYAGSYFLYGKAMSFVHELPKYSERIRSHLAHFRQQTSELEKTTQQVFPEDKNARKPMAVKVENQGTQGMVTEKLGAVTEIVLTLCFIPFLTYFMLSWQEHARTKSVQLFRPEYRSTAYVTLGHISAMMKSFIAGNFAIGLFMGICSVVIFGFLGVPYFYFIGFISGFLSLMPYLGIALAMLPPIAAGIGVMSDTRLLLVAATVLGLHMLAINVLYPKILGSRLQLNPLVMTISLLIWGFIWGAMGLILAVPIMAAVKIICDHVVSLRPIGDWMGE